MATEYGGYMGKILLIDLTTETTEEIPSQISSAEKPWEEKHWHTGFLRIK